MSNRLTEEWEDELLGKLDDGEEALASYDEVIRRFGTATETPLREMVATALLKKGMFLAREWFVMGHFWGALSMLARAGSRLFAVPMRLAIQRLLNWGSQARRRSMRRVMPM